MQLNSITHIIMNHSLPPPKPGQGGEIPEVDRQIMNTHGVVNNPRVNDFLIFSPVRLIVRVGLGASDKTVRHAHARQSVHVRERHRRYLARLCLQNT